LSSHREFPTPPQWRGEFGGGVNTPQLSHKPPSFRGKDGESGRGRREKGKGRGEGKGPPRVG